MIIKKFENRVFFFLVLLGTAVFLWMTSGFLMPVFWAIVLAVLFQPLYLKLLKRLKDREALSSFIATLMVVFVVLIPFGFIVTIVAQQALGLYQQIRNGQIDISAPISLIENHLPTVSAFLNKYGVDFAQIRTGIEASAIVVTQWIAGQALTIGQNLASVTVMFVLMLYFLFFLFRDGNILIEQIVRALPIGDRRERKLFRKFAEVARATVKGTLVVAAIQGAIGGVLFWIVGIQAPAFWAVVMGILSLLPAVGTGLIWGPAAIFLFAKGEVWQPVVLVIGGGLVIGLIDNLLRPLLVGRETKMPDYLVLLATLGGLQMFGLAGFIVGPIIAAVFLVMWQIFADEYENATPTDGEKG